MIYFIGVDPGLNGGIVIINQQEDIISKYIMPVIKDEKTIYDIISLKLLIDNFKKQYLLNNIYFFLEQAHVRPISGKRACFMNGYGFGLLRGILSEPGTMVEIVSPGRWMNSLGIKNIDKQKGSINFCLNKYPNENWCATNRCTNVHNGLTDACCIALYGKRLHDIAITEVLKNEISNKN